MHPSSLTRVFFTLLSLVISGASHGVVVFWALRFRPLARHRRAVIAVAVLLVLVIPLGRLAALAWRADWASRFFALAVTEMTLVVLSAVPLGLALLAAHWVSRWTVKAPADAGEPKGIDRRRLFEGAAGAAVLGATGSAFGWGMVRGRHAFEIEEVVVRVHGLPRALDGYTLAQISDIHVGTFVGERELREGLSRVDQIRPDLLVATGDLVDFDPRHAPLLARMLASTRARDGVVAIVGNHDYYSGVGAVMAAMRAAGVEVLLNAGKTQRPDDGGGFALLGVDDLWAQRSGGPGPDLDRALSMVRPDAPRILLAHQPNFVYASAGRVALQLSGHTHGGQINPGFRPAELFTRYVAGRYENAGTTLWVNRGFGVAGPPARIGAPPEVTRIVLVSA